ncbi:MAG: flagellar biosynthesis protein FlhB [Sandaracinaceae bacterium]
MADVDQDQKTEEATPKKQEELREKGSVAKSADVSAMATAGAVLAAMAGLGGTMVHEVTSFAERAFSLREAGRPMEMAFALGRTAAGIILPLGGIAAVAAIAATLLQTRGIFALAQLAPKPERLDPVEGIKKVLPTKDMLIETGKSLIKVAVVAVLVGRVIHEELPRFAVLPAEGPESAAAEVGSIAARLILHGFAILAALAAADYGLAWWKFRKESMMAKHEVKEEHKQAEGDPHIKGKRRAKQREMARARSVLAVADATVLVTNPTHIAVALRYEPDQGDVAPIMVGMGVEEVALRMRAEARKRGVPILENKPLARALHATGKIGRAIPFELYEAAAVVIAHVMGIRARVRGGVS